MTRKLRVYAEAPEPRFSERADSAGAPYCTTVCRHRQLRPDLPCELLGAPPTDICLPAIREMA